jgi:predicted dehydrogenase
MEHFVESILKDSPHMATGEEGVKVMQILDGIYESARTGKAIEVR